MNTEFNKRLAYAMTLKSNNYYERASALLDTLADALLYADAYKKEIDDALWIVSTLHRRHGKEMTSFLVAKVRDDREQALTCSLVEELVACLPDRRVEENESNNLQQLVAFIKSNKLLHAALQKNCSAQYLNRVLKNTALQAKGAKLKKIFPLIQHLF